MARPANRERRRLRVLDILLVLAFLNFLWVGISQGRTLRIAGYDLGITEARQALWILLVLVLLRLAAARRTIVARLRAARPERLRRWLEALLLLAFLHAVGVALAGGLTFRLGGLELGVRRLSTACWPILLLALLRLAAGWREAWAFLRSRRGWALLAILLLAAATRLQGIDFGLPAQEHPDEPVILEKVTGIAQGDLNPHYFVYPSLYFYAAAAALRAHEEWPALGGRLLALLAGERAEEFRVFLLGRLTTALFGVLTVLLLYAAGRRLDGRPRTGLLAALFLALAPLHWQNSMFATTDVPAAFFGLLAQFLALRTL